MKLDQSILEKIDDSYYIRNICKFIRSFKCSASRILSENKFISNEVNFTSIYYTNSGTIDTKRTRLGQYIHPFFYMLEGRFHLPEHRKGFVSHSTIELIYRLPQNSINSYFYGSYSNLNTKRDSYNYLNTELSSIGIILYNYYFDKDINRNIHLISKPEILNELLKNVEQ